jgi:drug/metabolite transporter (DMT)-like permease
VANALGDPTAVRGTRARPKRWILIAVAVAMNLAWAVSYPISKQLLSTVSPYPVAAARMAGAAVLLSPLFRRRHLPRTLSAKDVALLLVMGIFGCALASTLQYAGTALSTASNAAFISALEPSIVSVLAAMTLRERVHPRQLAAIALALVGVSLISVDPDSLDLVSSRYLLGNVVLFGSILCYASYTVASKGLAGRWGPSALTLLPFFIATGVLVPSVAVLRPTELARLAHLTPAEAASLAFLIGIATGLGYLVWNWLLQWLSAMEVALTIYIQPIAGALLATWLLHERLAPPFLAGAALVTGALVIGRPRAESGAAAQ